MSDLKILIAEDNDDIREAYELLLRHNGNLVDTAVDGEMGYKLATTKRYDRILLDVAMPRMDGIELARRLVTDHGYNKETIILTSSYSSDQVREIATERGLDLSQYVSKVFSKNAQIDQLQKLKSLP